MAQQLGFELPFRTARGRDAFFVAPSNALAVALIDGWQDWAGRKLVLSGPEGGGKTHLTHVWADVAQARIIAASEIDADMVPELAQSNIAVEDVPRISGNPDAQTTLFHLHNLVLAEGHSLLLTGRGSVASWGLDLPDLASRLQGTTQVTLDAPDDALLAAVLVKLFSDRQLIPNPNLIHYLLGRMDRSFAHAGQLVADLDTASIALKRPLTRALAAQVLDNSSQNAR